MTGAFAAPSDLDASFGTAGIVTTVVSSSNTIKALSLQADGKIIAAGDCSNANKAGYDICVVRYQKDGALDTSFNGTGKVIFTTTAIYNVAATLVLQPDGKILVGGNCTDGIGSTLCLIRILENGSFDTSFNETGNVIDKTSAASGIALQSDGRIVAAGACPYGTSNAFCVARFTPDGALDRTFSAIGKVITPVSAGNNRATTIALQPDGKIVLAGYCANGSSIDFCLARYLPDGTLDASFNSTGTVVTPVGRGSDLVSAVRIQPDGKIVVVGTCSDGNVARFCLARFQTSGALDTSFGGTGTQITPISGGFHDYAGAIALQPDGKIIVAGNCDGKFCVARFQLNGAPDTTFSSAGSAITTVSAYSESVTALALQPDGKFIVAGSGRYSGGNSFALARYLGGPNSPKTLTEYVYNPLSYYFLTSRDADKAALDAAPGWARTGQSFSSQTFAEPGALGISRFYFDKIAKNQTRGSHFYTLVDSEKTALNALNPANQALPRLPFNEGVDSYAFPPVVEGVGGNCTAAQTPVYRAFRGQARFPDDPNHRFTTSLSLYNQLVAQGWDGEGVKMCVPN